MSELTWRTKDGRVLMIREMETEHLRNAASMLRRSGHVTPDEFWDACSAGASFNGEMAQMAAENAIADMLPNDKLDAIESELANRRKE